MHSTRFAIGRWRPMAHPFLRSCFLFFSFFFSLTAPIRFPRSLIGRCRRSRGRMTRPSLIRSKVVAEFYRVLPSFTEFLLLDRHIQLISLLGLLISIEPDRWVALLGEKRKEKWVNLFRFYQFPYQIDRCVINDCRQDTGWHKSKVSRHLVPPRKIPSLTMKNQIEYESCN